MTTNRPLPILFLGDAAERGTGLGRIGRDLATLVSRMPQYRVGYLGLGGVGSRKLPFPTYCIQQVGGQWGEGVIERVWWDFAGRDAGVVMTIWDASRLLWFARPEFLPDTGLKTFLSSRHFLRWGYFPIDSTGPNDRLTSVTRDTLMGYDRIVAYTKWSDALIRRSIGDDAAQARQCDWFPHGINMGTFTPSSREEGRKMLSNRIHDNDILIGAVGTNQARKDWGCIFATVASLRTKVKRLKLWVHIDLDERYWSIPALASDYGLSDILEVSHELTDSQLALAYSACDVTLHPSSEGFGYPIAESLACGTPAIVGDYSGAGSAFEGTAALFVSPVAYRLDTLHNALRPVYEPGDWVTATLKLLEVPLERDACRASVSHLDWKNLWPSVVKKWFVTRHEELTC